MDKWNRKQHFLFFKDFEEPFFGCTANVDVSKAYTESKEYGISFFVYYLFCATKAANGIESFRYRIREDKVIVHDSISASPTINRPDGTFGFSYIDHNSSLKKFRKKAEKEIEKVRGEDTLIPSADMDNTIHFSALPWIKFTSLSHARSFAFKESIPKISFGKVFEENGKRMMPVSVHVHHALMDAYDLGRFLEYFQQLLDTDIKLHD